MTNAEKNRFTIDAYAVYSNFTAVISDYFQLKNIDIFLIFAKKHRLWVQLRTHNLCYRAKIRKIMHAPVNPSITIGGAVAWWLTPRTPDSEVGGSSPTRVAVLCP